MIKNNKNKAQEVLNSMLLPVKEVKENIIANKNLTELHKNNLLQMVCDFESYESKYDYKEALKIIAQIMQPYQNKTKSVVCQDGKQVEMPVGAKAMPYLIKQVLFYIVVMCKQYHNMNQKEILAILKENGIIVSHNFFSGNLPVTPIQYIQMMEHTQKESPIKYKGKKEGKLGIAIKHLAYQAGKYNNFVDIFGGSASATLAVSKRKGVTYVYNEKNKMMYHLIKIISDEKKYIRLIDALNSLKLDLDKVPAMTKKRVTVGCGTLYNLLEQFLEAKMICETKVEGRRRSYILTQKGKEMLEKEYARIQAQAQDYRSIFGEGD